MKELQLAAIRQARETLLIAAANFGGLAPAMRDRCIRDANALHEIYTASQTAAQPAVQHPDHSADASKMVQQPAEDDVFTALDMSPDTFRTEGGAVNVGKLRAAIRHPADYLPPDHWLAAAAPKGTT